MADPIALYIHWPFCVAKCPYCDFNSHVADGVDQVRWRNGLLAELGHWADRMPGRTVSSVFFGGGTPSLMDPATVAALLDKANDVWGLADDVEITLEANPSSVEVGRFTDLASAGVNRVSIGVQALDDDVLRFLGRVHDRDAALAALDAARRIFPRFSFDLIYARPGQTVAAWRDELGRALSLAGDHLSLYQLTIEPGTAFHRTGVETVDEDTAVALFELTAEMTAAAGLPAYEISNHARPGHESRHNLTYWRGGAYVGVGPGAHGRVHIDGTWRAVHQIATPDRWLAAVEASGHATAKEIPLSAFERAEEMVMTGLRLADGIECSAFDMISGVLDQGQLALMVDEGFLVHDNRGLRATDEGRLRLNAVIPALLAG